MICVDAYVLAFYGGAEVEEEEEEEEMLDVSDESDKTIQ